ncbi:MAG: hypothetical protein E7046_02465 [Lentisphaerae bacterium]|nr:hypothetical protein [Lentisphaerota bacterium]
MRRNKRIKKRSKFATSSMGVASLIVSGFIMLMIFFGMNSRCSSIAREIGKKEKELKRLEAELSREKTRWDEMKVPERLNIALARFGLEMSAPREEQLVRMTGAGVPAPGQLALKRMQGGSRSSSVASSFSHQRSRRSPATSVSRRRSRNGVR